MRNNNRKTDAGFTLIEMLVVVAVFVTVLMIALTIFVTISDTQKRIVSLQKIQEDIRFVLETMAQEIRLGRINYAYYTSQQIDLHPTAATRVETLALVDQVGDKIFFRKQGDQLQYQRCLSTEPSCPTVDWYNVTPAEVRMASIEFLITPSTDPFTAVSMQSCSLDSECTSLQSYKSYRCDSVAGRCEYFSDGGNFQPKVRIMLQTEGTSTRQRERASINVQTTVSSRVTQNEIANLYYDYE